MAETSIPLLKEALKDRFRADTDFKGIQISRGHPYPTPIKDKLVLIGKATSVAIPGSIGGTKREEDVVIEILISVISTPRKRYEDLEDEAYRIAALITNSIAEWQGENYQDIFCGWMYPGGTEDIEGLNLNPKTKQPEDREAVIKYRLIVKAEV